MHKYTWQASPQDHRDKPFGLLLAEQSLPTSVDLRPQCPPVYNQGLISSCTANASAAAYEFDLKRQGKTDFAPSRLFIYYNERVLDGTENDPDSGSYLRTAAKVLNKVGVCDETMWPYTMDFSARPTEECFAAAISHVSTAYHAIPNGDLNSMKVCLASGYPFIFGFIVYESFESEEIARTGKMNMPSPTEKSLGGHAVMGVGYDDATQCMIVRNSWGAGWGDDGYFHMPYEYISNPGLASDFWQITTVTG
jgi:C1A family cysteine protease